MFVLTSQFCFPSRFHCLVLSSPPFLRSVACLTRTPRSVRYLLCTSVGARYNFIPPSRTFTTLAFSFVKRKIHCNFTHGFTSPSALCNGEIVSSANFDHLCLGLARDSPLSPIRPSHVTKQQYGDCETNRICHCSEK